MRYREQGTGNREQGIGNRVLVGWANRPDAITYGQRISICPPYGTANGPDSSENYSICPPYASGLVGKWTRFDYLWSQDQHLPTLRHNLS
ncbi:MAG: hypothetical protein F6K65_13545 [Moorea sp. SIO3C2]|nr:hypothetical protein [Moorena sp. SIO3C2]